MGFDEFLYGVLKVAVIFAGVTFVLLLFLAATADRGRKDGRKGPPRKE